MTINRRTFLHRAVLAGLAGFIAPLSQSDTRKTPLTIKKTSGPVVISSGNGLKTVELAAKRLKQGKDPLDAAIAGVNLVELDPEDITVGYGGIPNERGVVQLDSAVMHGPTHLAGSVAALENIKTPSLVAKKVMERTDHVMLVGRGALDFAKIHGFKEENLLTEKARKIWLKWKESLSEKDDWIPEAQILTTGERKYGTIHCSALDTSGNLGSVTTTSGLFFKIPGRVGDSPIIGAGLFTDNAVGSAGATGRGEAVILVSGSRSVVSEMERGASPEEACLRVLKKIASSTKDPRLLDAKGHPGFNVVLYAISKSGGYGSACLWSGRKFAIHEAGRSRLEDCAYLFKKA